MQQRFFSYLKYAAEHNLLIALAAGLAAISPYVLYHCEINYILGVEVLFATFFIYTAQRFLGNLPSFRELPGWKMSLLVFSGFITVILAFFLLFTQVFLLFLAALLSVFYAYPAIPYKGSKRSLRQIPYLKIWVIVSVWVIVICFAPLCDLWLLDNVDLSWSNFFFIIQQGAFIFSLTIPFDIRDLNVDESDQKTIPMILGINKSVNLAKSAIWLSFFAAALNFLLGFFDLEIVVIQLLIVIAGLQLIRRSSTPRKNVFYLVWIDGLIALQAILFLLSYFI